MKKIIKQFLSIFNPKVETLPPPGETELDYYPKPKMKAKPKTNKVKTKSKIA